MKGKKNCHELVEAFCYRRAFGVSIFYIPRSDGIEVVRVAARARDLPAIFHCSFDLMSYRTSPCRQSQSPAQHSRRQRRDRGPDARAMGPAALPVRPIACARAPGTSSCRPAARPIGGQIAAVVRLPPVASAARLGRRAAPSPSTRIRQPGSRARPRRRGAGGGAQRRDCPRHPGGR